MNGGFHSYCCCCAHGLNQFHLCCLTRLWLWPFPVTHWIWQWLLFSWSESVHLLYKTVCCAKYFTNNYVKYGNMLHNTNYVRYNCQGSPIIPVFAFVIIKASCLKLCSALKASLSVFVRLLCVRSEPDLAGRTGGVEVPVQDPSERDSRGAPLSAGLGFSTLSPPSFNSMAKCQPFWTNET